MPIPVILILIIVGIVVSSYSKAQKKAAAQSKSNQSLPQRQQLSDFQRKIQQAVNTAMQSAQQASQPKPNPMTSPMGPSASPMRTAVENAQRSSAPTYEEREANRIKQEELKRRLKENAERRALERSASMGERKPLEKRELARDTSRRDKPVVVHTADDCTGGSIHDGYHEGVSKFPAKDTPRPIAVAGGLGHKLADEDDKLEKERAAVENARRALARISKLPPLAQGMVYSEILGKPKSEIA
ncbi:MAG: hypothetical protein K6G56_08390 [Clostridiales bacterium]|nr:hypothetical protein [Clostridiales bacterium]